MLIFCIVVIVIIALGSSAGPGDDCSPKIG